MERQEVVLVAAERHEVVAELARALKLAAALEVELDGAPVQRPGVRPKGRGYD
jgi:hypothetical protein